MIEGGFVTAEKNSRNGQELSAKTGRLPNGQFAPGSSGNVRGRPRNRFSIRHSLRQLLQLSQEEWPKVPMCVGQDLAMGRIKLCEELEDPKDRTKAIDSLINLTDGKPRQQIYMDMTEAVDMPPEQVRRRYQELSEELDASGKERLEGG